MAFILLRGLNGFLYIFILWHVLNKLSTWKFYYHADLVDFLHIVPTKQREIMRKRNEYF